MNFPVINIDITPELPGVKEFILPGTPYMIEQG